MGVGIAKDLTGLRQQYPHRESFTGFVELPVVAALFGFPAGLKALAGAFGLDFPKLKKVRLSDWSHGPLTPFQVDYAALDAFVGV